LLAFSGSASEVSAQRLVPNDPSLIERFGGWVSISGDTAVVGDPLNGTSHSHEGAA
jgi:hypothetical protein